MRIQFFKGFLLFTVSFFVFAYQNPDDGPINKLLVTQFDIKPIQSSSNGTNSILLSKHQLIQKFGTPQKDFYEFSEVEDANINILKFRGAEVHYLNGSFYSLSVVSTAYVFIDNKGRTLKVGDNLNAAIRLFPLSWKHKPMPNQLFVALEYEPGKMSDSHLIIRFDERSRTILEIIVY